MIYLILFMGLCIGMCAALYRYRVYRQERNKKVVGRVMSIFFVGILFVACAYSAMLLDTHSLMKEVRDAFEGKTPPEVTDDTPLSRYNIRDRGYGVRKQETEIGEATVSLTRYFTIHNFKDGYIWAVYSDQAYDSDRTPLSVGGPIPTKWKIHKENGKWEIAEIFEAP